MSRTRMPAGSHEESALGKVYDARLLLRLWRYVRPHRGRCIARDSGLHSIGELERCT